MSVLIELMNERATRPLRRRFLRTHYHDIKMTFEWMLLIGGTILITTYYKTILLFVDSLLVQF